MALPKNGTQAHRAFCTYTYRVLLFCSKKKKTVLRHTMPSVRVHTELTWCLHRVETVSLYTCRSIFGSLNYLRVFWGEYYFSLYSSYFQFTAHILVWFSNFCASFSSRGFRVVAPRFRKKKKKIFYLNSSPGCFTEINCV